MPWTSNLVEGSVVLTPSLDKKKTSPEIEAVPTTSKLVSGVESPMPNKLLTPSMVMVEEPTVIFRVMVKSSRVPVPLTVKELEVREFGFKAVVLVAEPVLVDGT